MRYCKAFLLGNRRISRLFPSKIALFDLDARASLRELGLDLFSLGLRNAFLERFRSTVDQIFGFLEAKTGNDLSHHLNDGDLVATGRLEDNVERILFLSCSGTGAITGGSCHH